MESKTPNQSEFINELAAALSKAQGKIEGAKKDAANPFFKSKYADLASIWDACRQPLTENGLSVVQMPEVHDGRIELTTTLLHCSGQWMASTLHMTPVKADPQGIGSCITYARRYALAAVVGVCPEDDDGNAATHGKAAPAAKAAQQPERTQSKKPDPTSQKDAQQDPQKDPTDDTTNDELKEGHILALWKANGIDVELAKKWFAGHGCDTLADIPDKTIAKMESDPAKFKSTVEAAK